MQDDNDVKKNIKTILEYRIMNHSSIFDWLPEKEQQRLLGHFPKNIKLSYEKMLHNKVYDSLNRIGENKEELFMAIPKGKKGFVWFFEKSCYFLELSRYSKGSNQFESVKKVKGDFAECFHQSVFYGTLVYMKTVKTQGFFIEDILYDKNVSVGHRFWSDKLVFLRDFLKKFPLNRDFFLGLPLIRKKYEELVKGINEIKDQVGIYCILIKPLKGNGPSLKLMVYQNEKGEENAKEEKKEIPEKENSNHMKVIKPSYSKQANPRLFVTKKFKVKADIQNDIYHLYEDKITNDGEEGKIEKYVDVAYIPDYKTSVMMNSLFRIIKENQNLDTLEESDDEEEFENDKEDRFVYLDKVIIMECYQHPKFKKWVPIKV